MPITPKAWANRPSALNPNVGETLADWETRVAAYAAANPGVLTPADAAALIDLETRMGAYADTAVASEASARATAVTAEATARTAADAGKQATSEKAQANGYAGLDGAGKVPKAQLPTLAAADLNADVASQAELDTAVANAQLRSEKGQPNGYAPLNGSSRVPIANLASGTPDGTKFIRDDGTLVTPAGGGGGSGLPATIQNKTANYTAVAGDFVQADASGATFTVTLPAGSVGQLVTVKKVDATGNAVAVVVTGGGTIDGDAGGASITSPQFGAIFECTATGVWKVTGVTSSGGSNGVNGNTILTTSGAPSNATGVNGDYAIDPTAQLIYGPKAAGAWPAGVSYKGNTGNAGTNGILANFQDEGGAVTARDTLDVQGNAATLSQNGVKLILAVPGGDPRALTGATAATRYVGGTASGAPSSGTFAVGDYVVDQTGKMWVCTVAGTPGTWVQVGGGGGGGDIALAVSGKAYLPLQRAPTSNVTHANGFAMALGFVPIASQSLAAALVHVTSTLATAGTHYRVAIYTDGPGFPKDPLLNGDTGVVASGLVDGSTGVKTILFATPPAVVAGTRYWVVGWQVESVAQNTTLFGSTGGAGANPHIPIDLTNITLGACLINNSPTNWGAGAIGSRIAGDWVVGSDIQAVALKVA